jgi:hypothetical protein
MSTVISMADRRRHAPAPVPQTATQIAAAHCRALAADLDAGRYPEWAAAHWLAYTEPEVVFLSGLRAALSRSGWRRA